MEILINNFSEIESIKDSLTFGKVKFLYGTGRSNTFTTVHGKVTTYRCGVMTEIGDIEESVWMQIVEFLIKKSHEIELYHNLLEWVKERSIWCTSETERKEYALRLHATRIFDNQEWVDYRAFNAKYRPNIIEDQLKKLLWRQKE